MQTQEIVGKKTNSPNDKIILPNLSFSYRFTKRAIDILGSVCLLLFLSPILLLTMILVKIENPRARIFFKQLRAGKNGMPFYCYKFRTMIPGAEKLRNDLLDLNEMDGPVFKIENDPRITAIGRNLRRFSIDEFPQLVHVFTGVMSLVGPRPLPVAEADGCNERQKLRELVKPGCVCYWQVSGRNEISFEQWMEMDIRYINEMSFWTDIKLLLSTIPAVFSKKGAY